LLGQKQVVEEDIRSGLEQHGIRNLNAVYCNLEAPALIEQAIERREGHLAANGALVVRTGQYTGRSPKDKFLVRDELTADNVQWAPSMSPSRNRISSASIPKCKSSSDGGRTRTFRTVLWALTGSTVWLCG
jgi:ATP-dependent phosphoenolpyruvate carboxykinase